MSSCNHTSWLSFYKQEQITLRQTSALHDIVATLDTPAEKYPSLIVLTGDVDESGRLCDFIPRSRKRPDSEYHTGLQLQLDNDTAFMEYPILVAHGCMDAFNETEPESAKALCHTHGIRELRWSDASSKSTPSAFFSRLLKPFAQLVCFFVSDGESPQRTASRLRDWCEVHRDLSQQSRLIIVAAPAEERSAVDIHRTLTKLFQKNLEPNDRDLLPRFSVHGRHDQQTLQDRIHSELSHSRENRMRSRTLLSAVHFESLFSRACDHFIASGSEPFDMIAASRLHRPVSSSLGEHVADLLAGVDSYEELTQFAVPFIAECLRLDNYTSDVHGFAPTKVFETHYRTACSTNLENKTLKVNEFEDVMIVRAGLVKQIKKQFLETTWTYRPRSRFQVLAEYGNWLSRRRTHKSCLPCLARAPEHSFTCQHILCEERCVELGRSTAADPCVYDFSKCPLCTKPCNLRIRVRPATAGMRVLAIDGGGIRAVIPIQFLRALQQAVACLVGSAIPIQELFDLSFGTSSGSMVNLALYGLGMDVGEVFHVFKDLSSRVFQGRIRLGFGPVDTIYTLLAAYWNGRFPDKDIDGPLHELFGKATMLEHPYMTAIGARTGFPVVNLDTLNTCLVTSYNGAGKSRPELDAQHRATYQLLRSGGHNDRILVKDGVRSASAAPGYFTPYTIPHHGTFMDGGISSNNPSLLALQEARRLAPELKRPDQFVSVGTGVSKASDAHVANTRSSKYGNNSLLQAAQHYWKDNFDGDKQFASMRHVMDVSAPGDTNEIDSWFRRFNLPLDGQLPDLADANAIDNLAEAAWSYFESYQPIQELALSSIASLFYFELRCMPAYGNGRYTCYGRILCRFSVLSPALPKLIEKLEEASARFVVNGKTLLAVRSKFASLDRSGNFSKPVCFHVSSLSDPIDMRLRLTDTQILPISASPSSIASFAKLQRLDWPGSRRMPPSANGCRKRAVSSAMTASSAKRFCIRRRKTTHQDERYNRSGAPSPSPSRESFIDDLNPAIGVRD